MKNNKKGFTLAELLVVVAIIAVLVAIAIPVFSGAQEKANEAVDAANLRAAYAEAMSKYLTDGSTTAIEVTQKQTEANWTTTFDFPENFTVGAPTGKAGSTWSVAMNSTGDAVTATYAAKS